MSTIFQQIAAALNWNVRVNENFVSVSPAGLYGVNPATTTGLTLGYLGGNFNGVAVANGTVALTASTTNYVVAHRTTGAVTAATSTTNWLNTTTYIQLFQVVTGSSTITSIDDKRQLLGAGAPFTGGTLSSSLNEAPAVSLASAATVNIGAAAANTINITGTTTITAFDSIASGAVRELVFAGVLTLTHNATSLILPTGANVTTQAGDAVQFLSLGSGNWKCIKYQRADGTALSGSPFAGGTLSASLNLAPAVTVASAATTNIGAAASNNVSVTGTTTITAFDSIADGAQRTLTFAGILSLTHNATSLILPTGSNITTAAGDVAEFVSLGAGNWRCIGYMRANGQPVAGGGAGSTQGKQAISVTAGGIRPSVTGGCASLAAIASAANQPDIVTLNFDAATAEYAQFSIPMPKKWNAGTVTARFRWSHAATATNFGVVWGIQALALSDDDAIAQSFGTAQTVTDTGGTTNDLYVTAETSAITIAGTPVKQDMVFFRVYRDATNGSDTMTIDARLHAVEIFITTDADTDA